VVVPRPNAATISADKMKRYEVLLTQCLFLLLVSDNDVSASAPD
jgi:hypothetical protein